MPLYEYRCLKCGIHLEKIQKFSDPPLTNCEKCDGKLERLLSSPAIHFKGSGWYVTDYARKSQPSQTDKLEKAPAGTGKTDTPSAGKGESPAAETKKAAEPSPATKSKDT